MLFIAKFTITYQPLSDSRNQEAYKDIHNRIAYCARMCCAQMDYDYQIEHGYYDQFQELDLYRDVIYVYLKIVHTRSYASMAKLPPLCHPLCSPENYQPPKMLK